MAWTKVAYSCGCACEIEIIRSNPSWSRQLEMKREKEKEKKKRERLRQIESMQASSETERTFFLIGNKRKIILEKLEEN